MTKGHLILSDSYSSWRNIRKNCHHLGHQRTRVLQSVCWRTQNDKCDTIPIKLVLVRNPRIHCQHHVELILGLREQRAVLHTSPAFRGNRDDIMAGKVTLQAPIKILIQQILNQAACRI